MKNITYYIGLIIKKTKITLHNKFEPKVKADEVIDLESFKVFLWGFLYKNLYYTPMGYFFKTRITNNKSPMILSQIRVILILVNNLNNDKNGFNKKFLISSMTKYLLSMRSKNGLFKFNQVSWDLQDEGIASVWATLALVKSYEVTKETSFFDAAFLTMQKMITNLYSKETSLIHTKGDNFWCLNSASTFAYVCSLLLEYKYDESIKSAMNESIELCNSKIADDGHFPYNYMRQGTYLLLYHPIVIITLEYCLNSNHLEKKIRENLLVVLQHARNFLIKSIDKNDRIFEPEIKHYSQYIITCISSLLALKNFIPKSLELSLLNNVIKFWKENTLFLCRDNNDFLYNSDLYSVKDVLTIEVLYWLDLYLKK
jgi:hypothetical protein